MRIKRYIAQSLQFAIRKVKAELGEDAIILNTKRRKKGGFLGLFGREVVEITAAVSDSPGVRPFPAPPPPPPGSSSPSKEEEAAALTVLHKELDEIKTMVAGLSEKTSSPEQQEGELFKAYHILAALNNLLVQNDVTVENAAALVKKVINLLPEEELQDYQRIKTTLIQNIASDLKAVTPLTVGSRQRVVALVGPTGVGKTTTVAKMAAKSALLQNRDVALITADTYRIAAVEQLRRYAEIIDVPLEVILGADELQKALGRHRDKSLILIDTAGRSQRSIVQLSELRSILDPATQIETLLVMSLTTKYRDLLDITAKFQRVNYDALLFTKLDETTSYGSIFNIVKATGKPLTYVTTGQNVPDDIEAAEPVKIAKMILGES